MAVLFLFIDGVGLGDPNPDNPFHRKTYEAFSFMTAGQPFIREAGPVDRDHHLYKAVDATLGVEGLPQSGTGQTALFTGENASHLIGKHFGPYPHSGIKHLLREQSLFIKAQRLEKSCRFINAYPPVFFENARKKNRWSCTTLMTKSAGIPLHTPRDVEEGGAVTAGITQQAWKEKLDMDVPVITSESAAKRLLAQAEKYDLILSEYYLTDKAGHNQDVEQAHQVLSVYDEFLMALIRAKKPEDTLVLSSDHGNVEDLSQKTHTLNKVPLFVYGPGKEYFKNATNILDVTPGILEVLKAGR